MMSNLTKLFLHFLLMAKVVVGIPGQPGKEWTPQEVKIIQEKLKRLWDKPIKILEDFDPLEDNAEFKDFVFDPTEKTMRPDCQCCCPECAMSTYPNCTAAKIPKPNECQYADNNMCRSAWNKNGRKGQLAFDERKMLRLAFHDCVKYTPIKKEAAMVALI